MRNGLKIAAAALLIAGTATAASAQAYGAPVYGVPGVDFGYPPYAQVQTPHIYYAAPATRRVYENGKLIGQDPDPNVRMMLRKDFAFE